MPARSSASMAHGMGSQNGWSEPSAARHGVITLGLQPGIVYSPPIIASQIDLSHMQI